MERSFVSRFGKWIALALVVLLLGLWFFFSGGTENYYEKYKDVDLSVAAEDIGRDNTYSQYLNGSTFELDLSSIEAAEGVSFQRVVGLTEDGGVLYGNALPTDTSVTLTANNIPFVRYYNVLLMDRNSVARIPVSITRSGYYTLDSDLEATLDGQTVPEEGLYLMPGEYFVELNSGDQLLVVFFVRMTGPIRYTTATADVSIALEEVAEDEGVAYHAAVGVTADGAFLDEAGMAEADSQGRAYTKVENAVVTLSGSSASWKVNVPEAGYYNVELSYYTGKSRGVDMERALLINGELPFDGADTMTFSRLWTDEGTLLYDEAGTPVLDEAGYQVRVDAAGDPMRTHDNQGNEIRPAQVEIFGIEQTAYCRDAMGYITDPYLFYFEAGENTITLNAESEPMLLTSIALRAPTERDTYEEYLAIEGDKPQNEALANAQPIVIEGEHSARRSSPSLYARYDRSSPSTVPYDVAHTVLNFIGGDAWRDAGQWIEWNFVAPEDGWYNITVKGRQTYSRGAVSSRIVYVDGKILFSEMENLGFQYSSAWQMNTLSTQDGTPCRIWLTKGEHTIRLEATLGNMGSILSDMEESIYRLNSMYRKILVLTGVTPDQYRDYRLDEKYPEIIVEMFRESRRL